MASDREMAASLATDLHAIMRQIARQEIASMAGLVLRRAQEEQLTRLEERNIAEETVNAKLRAIFGEVLSDFSGHTKGEEPGS